MSTVVIEKTCDRCKQTKAASEFNRHRRQPDGLQPWCAACQHAHYYGDADGTRRGRHYTVRDIAESTFRQIEVLGLNDSRVDEILARARERIA